MRSVVSSLRESEQSRPKSVASGNDAVQGDKGKQVSEKNTEDATHSVTRYERMKKEDLQEELGRLQGQILDAERTASQAKKTATIAARAYESASDDEKAAALLRMIEAKASSREPNERLQEIFLDFNAAKKAYLRLLDREFGTKWQADEKSPRKDEP